MAYATPSDLVARYDARRIGDFVSDNGVRVTEADLSLDDKVLTALESASGEVEVALMQGARYSVDDLATLQGSSREFLKSLVCDIAFCRLYERRGWSDDDAAPDLTFKRSQESLARLRKGENVFNIAEHVDAGLPSMTSTASRPQVLRPNMMTDTARGSYFPLRRS